MRRIVYVLGAGFSAPLGLPLMNNFWEKSKDLLDKGVERYEYFGEVIKRLNQTLTVPNFFEYERFNIEEALSILEFSESLGNEELKQSFVDYIADVIEYYTPEPPKPRVNPFSSNWEDQ
jgi:hypothetical protein